MSLNEAMERAALAWLADRVTEVGQLVNPRLAGELADWLAKMPSADRHGSQAATADDGHTLTEGARSPYAPQEGISVTYRQSDEGWTHSADGSPATGRDVEIRSPHMHGLRTQRKVAPWDVLPPDSEWRYI